jgi:branched-chain amino acid transport system ATP-binding protein
MALLEVRDLGVRFGGLKAVDGLGFAVAEGTIKGLIGPNGAGKTTVFNAITGLAATATGDVLLDGQSIAGLRPFERAARGLARTFQNLQIFRDLSLLENVMIGRHVRTRAGFIASMLRLPGTAAEELDAEARAYDKLALLGLAARALEPASALAFGEAKLVEIARALVSEPRLLLLDEPAAGVPHAEQARFMDIIRRVNAEGVTVLLVEHNMRLVMNLCDDILVLNYGQRLAEGPPAEVSRDREVIMAYLGEEPVHA